MLRQIHRDFFNKCHFSREKIIENHQIALKLYENKEYKKAAEFYSSLLEENKAVKGSPEYINLLENQSKCYYYLREYSEYETNYLNIVEYCKYNLQNKEFQLSDLFYYYMKTLEIFIYSGSDKVFLLLIVKKVLIQGTIIFKTNRGRAFLSEI